MTQSLASLDLPASAPDSVRLFEKAERQQDAGQRDEQRSYQYVSQHVGAL